MVDEVYPNLYRIEVPLPKNPLQSLNSYVITGPDRNLIIDTGMNREECRSVMHSGLQELEVDLRETDLFITHFHADHLGLVADLATESSRIYFNQPDATMISLPGMWQVVLDLARMNGFPAEELQNALRKHPGYKYSPKSHPEFEILTDGDTLRVGDYVFECVETPGHSPGHLCLYEADKKFLIAGDHVLYDITPNISQWDGDGNTLTKYLASLDKVCTYDIERVLPGHRSLFDDCKGRVEELKHHHQVRADEVLAIVEAGVQDAFHVASQMSWDIECDSWDEFPITQKWFATGEALAHLYYLEAEGRLRTETRDDKVLFSLT